MGPIFWVPVILSSSNTNYVQNWGVIIEMEQLDSTHVRLLFIEQIFVSQLRLLWQNIL